LALPPRLDKELEELRSEYQVDVSEEGDWINLIFRNFPLGEGFNVVSSDLLVRIQRTYPDAGPDMFWLDTKVTLSSGQAPQNAEAIEGPYTGRTWRRFSWHRQIWNPSVENLQSYLEFIRRRLREKK
jgi:E2/UBC family protein E